MGKHKQRFNKKEAVRFTLVPDFDQNGKPITHFRAMQSKESNVSAGQRQKLIKEISDQVYDQIQINGKLIGSNQIPAFVLQQIRGRKDLIFNQKQASDHQMGSQEQGDLYDVLDAEDYDDEDQEKQGKQWIGQQEIIDEEYDEDQVMSDEQGEWQEDDEQMEQESVQGDQDGQQIKKKFILRDEDFPDLNKINDQGKQYQLTEAQIKLLDVLIPENYENFKIKGLKFEKYDQNGLPLSQKGQYAEFLATGKQGIVDSFDFVPDKPTNIFDTDLKPSQITGDLRQVQEALNFQGQQEVYEELEDDFFAKLVKSQIQTNKKQRKEKKKTAPKTIKPVPEEVSKAKLPKVLQQPMKKQQNIFSKYDQLDDDRLEEEITDQMIDKALDDFQNNLEPAQSVMGKQIKSKVDHQLEEQMDQRESRNNASMNFSEIQRCVEFFGKDGQLDWRCLSKKEKKQYMKTKIIRDFYDQVRQRQIQEKIKGKKNVTAEQLHLKTMVKHLTFQEDHAMRKALENDAQEVVDLDENLQYQTSSEQQDIVEYHQRTSIIFSNLNEISQLSKRRPKKKKQDGEQRQNELQELSKTMSKLKASSQKRDRQQTKQERKERKQKQKQLKKQKKQIKKQFAEKFSQQRRKHMKMTKPTDPLHKVSYVRII